jgi:hypothetical protein
MKSYHNGLFKLMLLAMIVLQNSSFVLVGRYTVLEFPRLIYNDVNHLNHL